MPAVLMQLMRRESIETTLLYHAGQDAARVADAAWEACDADASWVSSSQERSWPPRI